MRSSEATVSSLCLLNAPLQPPLHPTSTTPAPHLNHPCTPLQPPLQPHFNHPCTPAVPRLSHALSQLEGRRLCPADDAQWWRCIMAMQVQTCDV
jgi:hypothetical protein